MDTKKGHNIILESRNNDILIGGSNQMEEDLKKETEEKVEESENTEEEVEESEEEEEQPEGDRIDLVKILEKISPNQINDFFSDPQSVLKSRPTLPSVDELTGRMFDGFLNSRLKDESKWENKCNVKTYPPSQDLEQDYLTFLDELEQLDEEAISNSGNKSSKSKGKKKGSFFSRIKKSMGFKGGASVEGESGDENEDPEDSDEEDPEVPQKGFLGHLEDVENHFIDKWKGVDLYQIFDELKPKPLLRAVKNPKFILDKSKPPVEESDIQDVCGEEWNLIMDHICQIRIRSHIIYLESLKTIDPELESNYDVQLLTQNNFEYDPENNPDGFKLDENIHYFHEPKPLTAMEKMKRKMERKMRSAKRTMRKIGNKLTSFKKTIKRKAGEAGRAVSSVSLPSVTMPGMTFSSEHDKKLDKHLEFQAANFMMNKINKQSERMKEESKRGRMLAQQSKPSLFGGPKKPPPKLNLVQKAVAHGVYGGEDNFRKVQKRFNSPTGKLLARHYKI